MYAYPGLGISRPGQTLNAKMSNLKQVLSSQPKKQKQIGLFVMITGIAGFMASMSYFRLFEKVVEHTAIALSKQMIAFSFLIFAMYGFGYAFGGKKIGFSFAKWWALLLIGAGVVGYLLHRG